MNIKSYTDQNFPTLFKNEYKRKSIRLKDWNYIREGIYFITICTKNRMNYFGKIINSNMQLSEIGNIAFSEWYKTPEIRPEMNINLGEFIIMPDHLHGIINIGPNEYNNSSDIRIRTDINESFGSNFGVKKGGTITNRINYNRPAGPQLKNLSSIIRGYKSAVTTYARKNRIEFNWQNSFYEHIIRTEEAHQRISKYIKNNPSYGRDKNNG